MNNFRQYLLKRPKVLIGALSTLVLLIVYASVYAGMQSQMPQEIVQTGNVHQESKEKIFSTVKPQLLNESSSVLLLGTVLSNETANLYPRRDGIVEDVLVDIGDTVQKNQVVALLLPKGVEGQSAAAIAEKKARQEQAQADYLNAQNVKEETVANTRGKIVEKETEVLVALREQESLLEKFALQEADILQKQEQAFTTISGARQLIEHILIGSNSRGGSSVYEEDVLVELGLLSFQTRYNVISEFDQLYSMEQSYNFTKSGILQLTDQANNALVATHALLSATPTVPNPTPEKYTHAELSSLISQVIALEDRILKAKEKMQDAQSAFDALRAFEPNLYNAYRTGNTDDTKSNKLAMLESQLATFRNNVGLTEASQQQLVDRNRTTVNIATAQLQSEYAQSGHRQIRSPFTGTVSKRFVDVGQIVMPSLPVFELTDVPTSLSKKAKAEVQFGLPENLLSAVNVGDTISFFLQADEIIEYTAEITRKSPQIDLQTQTVTVQAKIPDDIRLPHQSSVRVHITDNKNPIYRVPSSAVKRSENANSIWILDTESGKPMQVTVSVLAEEGEFAEVTGNITTDTSLILDPPDLLHD